MEFLANGRAFYECLVKGVHRSNRRIIMSSLYWGGGVKEALLMHLLTRREGVRINVILDEARFTSNKNSIFFSEPRIKCIQLASPNNYFFLPSPIREIFGVYHSKYFIFDDQLVVTGANISHDYFGPRLDQYVRITLPFAFREDARHLSLGQHAALQPENNDLLKTPYFSATRRSTVVTSSYNSNGFSHSSTLRKIVPFFYQELHCDSGLAIFHLLKRTFHSKGLMKQHGFLFGSSNFNHRSSDRDLETVLWVDRALKVELQYFQDIGHIVRLTRKTRLLPRFLLALVSRFL